MTEDIQHKLLSQKVWLRKPGTYYLLLHSLHKFPKGNKNVDYIDTICKILALKQVNKFIAFWKFLEAVFLNLFLSKQNNLKDM